jgi:D-3-phosphoglycerate dehydrogenase
MNKISPLALNYLKERGGYEISDSEASPDAILVRSADLHSYEINENLSCIVRAGAGTNNIPVKACSEKGIVVFNTPGANANAVKELVICALLLSSRDIVGGIEWAKTLRGKGDEVGPLVEKGKSSFVGPEIMGKTLGIIGLGAIGGLVANAAIALGMNAIGYDPYLSVKNAWLLSRSVANAPDYNTVYEQSDYLTLHAPANGNTKHMINRETLSVMKDGVRIINLARGELVDDDALIEALDSGKVSCYVTDFPNEKLLAHKKVIAIPHLGASTPESEENCADMAVTQLVDFLENGNITNSVNFPDVEVSRAGHMRICVTHANIPNVLSPISGTFSSLGVNISNMVNKSKGDFAYTILDVDSDVPDDTISKIASLKGVLRVRAIR